MEEWKIGAEAPDPFLLVSIFKASPIGIALEDLEGRPLFANPALCSMLGFSEEEMRSKHCVEFSPAEDAQKDWALFEQLRAGSIDHYQLEKRFFRRDGSLIRGRLSISLVGSGASRLVVAMVEALTGTNGAQEELPQAAVEKWGRFIDAQEQERARIANKVHNYIDNLSVLSIDLARFEQNPPESVTKARQEIRGIKEQAKELLRDIGGFYRQLHSSHLEYLGLVPAARSLCKELSESEQVQIDFECDGVETEVPKQISLCLYRALQEALRNAIQHSGSQRFEVALRFAQNDVHLIVHDWGSGFDLKDAMKKSGLGLISIRERIRHLAGKFLIESKPGRGTTIHAQVPLKT